MWSFPIWLAIQSGVAPSFLGTSALAPAANSISRTVRCPFCAEIKSGVARSYERMETIFNLFIFRHMTWWRGSLFTQRQSLELYLHERIDVGTSIEQLLDDIRVPALTRDEQRRPPVHWRTIDRCAGLQQNFGDVEKAALCSEEKCSRAGLLE